MNLHDFILLGLVLIFDLGFVPFHDFVPFIFGLETRGSLDERGHSCLLLL